MAATIHHGSRIHRATGDCGADGTREVAAKPQGPEVDVVVTDNPAGGLIIAIGEAKAAMTPVHVRELRRLEHLRGVLPSARVEQPPKLLLVARP